MKSKYVIGVDKAGVPLCMKPEYARESNTSHKGVYDKLYEEYCCLHDYFGRGENNVMKRINKKR